MTESDKVLAKIEQDGYCIATGCSPSTTKHVYENKDIIMVYHKGLYLFFRSGFIPIKRHFFTSSAIIVGLYHQAEVQLPFTDPPEIKIYTFNKHVVETHIAGIYDVAREILDILKERRYYSSSKYKRDVCYPYIHAFMNYKIGVISDRNGRITYTLLPFKPTRVILPTFGCNQTSAIYTNEIQVVMFYYSNMPHRHYWSSFNKFTDCFTENEDIPPYRHYRLYDILNIPRWIKN